MSVDVPKIISRAEWGAATVVNKMYEKKGFPIFTVFVSRKTGLADCTTNEECMKILKEGQTKAISDQKLTDIPFSFIISREGTIYEGRGWEAKPQKAIQMEDVDFHPFAFDIGFFGDYEKEEVPDASFSSMISLLQAGVNQKYVDKDYDLEPIHTATFEPELRPGVERLKKIKKIKVKGPIRPKPYKGEHYKNKNKKGGGKYQRNQNDQKNQKNQNDQKNQKNQKYQKGQRKETFAKVFNFF